MATRTSVSKALPPRECVAVGECRPPHRGSKDRRRWCKGREGVEHVWEWRQSHRSPRLQDGELGYRTEYRYCATCGKDGMWIDTRSVCHCGEVMDAPVRRWSHSGGCSACGYEPSETIPCHVRDGKMVPVRARVQCRCEPAWRKVRWDAAKMAKYGRTEP